MCPYLKQNEEWMMNKFVQVLIDGVKEFYQRDADMLFRGKPIDERA